MRALCQRSALLVSALFVTSCSIVYGDELDDKQCKVDADCEAAASRLHTPLVCRQNACQAPTCSESSECPSGSLCSEGLCIADTSGPDSDAGSDAAPEPVSCVHDTDCDSEKQQLCGLDGFCYTKWACLDQDPDWPSPPASLSFQVQLLDSTQPPAMNSALSVSACTSGDPGCNRPIVTNKDVTISTEKLLTVPFTGLPSSGFLGAVRIESTMQGSGMLPSYIHFTAENPLVNSLNSPRPLQLIAQSRLSGLGLYTGITANPEAAGVFFHIFDCGGRPASEVSLKASNPGDSVVIPLQGETGLVLNSNKTTATGTLIMINLPPSMAQVFTLRDEETGRLLTDTFNFIPRGAAVNAVTYYPRYSTLQRWASQAQHDGGVQ